MSDGIVTVNLMISPPRPEPSFICVPTKFDQKEIGLFLLISRLPYMHGVFWLYLGGSPTADAAGLFVLKNEHAFCGEDWVIVGMETFDTTDEAYDHLLKITTGLGTVDKRCVFFMPNMRVL